MIEVDEVDMLLERVVALLCRIEGDYLCGLEPNYKRKPPQKILEDEIDSIINVRCDAADLRRKIKGE